MGDLAKNFSTHEFVCPCCGKAEMDPDFMEKLQRLRESYGRPFSPVKGGGYRCARYGSPTTAHREGKAIDPNIPREDYYRVMGIAFLLGFSGIGVKQRDGRYQLHLDTAFEIPGVRPRPWIWTY